MNDTDLIYESAGFRLLAQGMKDKHAFAIMLILLAGQRMSMVHTDVFEQFNEWAEEKMEEETDK